TSTPPPPSRALRSTCSCRPVGCHGRGRLWPAWRWWGRSGCWGFGGGYTWPSSASPSRPYPEGLSRTTPGGRRPPASAPPSRALPAAMLVWGSFQQCLLRRSTSFLAEKEIKTRPLGTENRKVQLSHCHLFLDLW